MMVANRKVKLYLGKISENKIEPVTYKCHGGIKDGSVFLVD
jgi:hypothetical protein